MCDLHEYYVTPVTAIRMVELKNQLLWSNLTGCTGRLLGTRTRSYADSQADNSAESDPWLALQKAFQSNQG